MVRGNLASVPSADPPDFYWERQSGGLCRMHAINAYFGAPKLDRASFEAEIAEYDAEQKSRGRDIPSACAFDTTSSDHKNIISHILAKNGVFARFYDARERPRAVTNACTTGVAFLFTPDHIWLIRRDSTGSWFKIDSLSGITRCDFASISRDMLLGIIVPTRDLRAEFLELGAELNALVMPDIIDYLIGAFREKKVIGEAETLMGACCTVLEIQNNGRPGYEKLTELFVWYNEFTRNFTGRNCASLEFILHSVPQIIARILAIWRCSNRITLM